MHVVRCALASVGLTDCIAHRARIANRNAAAWECAIPGCRASWSIALLWLPARHPFRQIVQQRATNKKNMKKKKETTTTTTAKDESAAAPEALIPNGFLIEIYGRASDISSFTDLTCNFSDLLLVRSPSIVCVRTYVRACMRSWVRACAPYAMWLSSANARTHRRGLNDSSSASSNASTATAASPPRCVAARLGSRAIAHACASIVRQPIINIGEQAQYVRTCARRTAHHARGTISKPCHGGCDGGAPDALLTISVECR